MNAALCVLLSGFLDWLRTRTRRTIHPISPAYSRPEHGPLPLVRRTVLRKCDGRRRSVTRWSKAVMKDRRIAQEARNPPERPWRTSSVSPIEAVRFFVASCYSRYTARQRH
ncbi:hypothetical protein BV20DRAFT_266798 [Pilatotrama ljubarskyi]|nr:hypothetical protein BV20DRAFT_266798 [Pilatotrama ljubarskyi]